MLLVSVGAGLHGPRGIVFFPGQIVMAELLAVIAREVKEEICGNNKPSENTFQAS